MFHTMNQLKDIPRTHCSPACLLACQEIVGVEERKRGIKKKKKRKRKHKERRKIVKMNYLFFETMMCNLY
jgi:hypothetical protein